MGDIVEKISGEEMKQFAVACLGFASSEVADVSTVPCGSATQTNYAMLETWRKVNSNQGSNRTEDLITALEVATKKGLDTRTSIEKLKSTLYK